MMVIWTQPEEIECIRPPGNASVENTHPDVHIIHYLISK
jgi:hypothetical protein